MVCVFCSGRFVSAAMAHVFVLSCDAFAQRIASYAVVCDALCSALLLQSALDGLEPLSLGLINFRTWHLRIRKNMKFKSQRPAGEDVWGGPAALLAPGQARLTRARIFLPEKPNEHESNSPRKARRPAPGERLRFLEPDRRRTAPIGVGSAKRLEAAIFAPLIPYLDVSADSLAARGRRRRGSRSLQNPAHKLELPLSAQNEAIRNANEAKRC